MLRLADNLRKKLVELPRNRKRMLQVFGDILLIWLALWLAFFVRLGEAGFVEPFQGHGWLFLTAPLVSIPIFFQVGLYRAVMRYFGNDALLAIMRAVTLSTLILALAIYWRGDHAPKLIPRSMVFNFWWLNLLLLGGMRLVMRSFFLGGWLDTSFKKRELQSDAYPRVAIYGAGAAGNQLLAALRMGRSMLPVAFIDDDLSIDKRVIAGLRVYKSDDIKQMLKDVYPSEILLAIPSASRARRSEILAMLEPFPLHVRSVPGFMDLASGKVKVDDLQEVDIADLLGRDAVPPQKELFERCIKGQSVLVTGAGGSIGSELCRQVVSCGAKILVLFEHSEFNLYSIHRELEQYILRNALSVRLVPILGSIKNAVRLQDVLVTWSVNTVYHAAAYKHVPMVEHNISEGVLNNVIGTVNAAQSAIKCGVQNFVLISTDKAVRPTNVMGSTKRLAEMVLQALSAESAPVLMLDPLGLPIVNRTRFTMVRFGNVLGSSGSVIPFFREQIVRGGPITVTHPNITRYFMTIPEAAQLVIQAGSLGIGGDVFVLDMGKPVRIVDLAEKMVKLSGLTLRSNDNAHGDIAIEFSGLRPGEKLYEELLIGDNVQPTEHAMIMRANEEFIRWEELKLILSELLNALEYDDFLTVRKILRENVNGYIPDGDIVDHVYMQRRMNNV
ncbi:polysaccharide biosynthesis protein [Pseudomonas guariconensis]|uniref:polysaccharide biosynthesis protein n=1 Tax=Pseudomonas guariconensis TaxID=1288410 RepID=UPI0036F19A8D